MSSSEIADIIVLVNKYSGLPGIIFYLLFLVKRSNIGTVFFVLLASFAADVLTVYYVKNIYPNSFVIISPWYILNYILVSWLFIRLLPRKSKVIICLLAIFVIGTIISYLFFYSPLESNTFIMSYSSAVFTYLSILAFIEILRENPAKKLIQYPVFWIVTGLFLFSSISLIKHLFQHYLVFDLQVSMDIYIYVWMFGVIFNIIKNLMFFYSFVLVKKGFPNYIYKHEPNIA